VDFHVTHDALTELPNRQRFVALLNQRLQRDTGHEDPVAVLLVDLDRFKNINDSLGHSVGDGVLQQVAQRLLGLVSERGFVARMGADEFLVMDQLAGGREVLHLAERIVRSLGAVYLVQSLELHLAASVGATTYPFDHAPAEVLISHADEAMYDAKRDGGNALRFFVPGTTVHTLDRLQLENDLWHAAERGQLVVHYQPKVGIADARIVGFEALARWLHPVRGWIPPADFIPLAETSDVIQHIGQWILEQACRQLAIWHASGFGGLQIAVNLSARQFRQQSLVSSIDTALERHGLEPHHLELEVTESMVMTDFERARETLRRLSERGLRIAVDDFGTGHSSLSYLKKLPITGLKIDRSFVADLGRDTASDALVRAIVTLGQGLGMQTIAEGVETRQQLACLQSFGCDLYQGYLYSRPCTAVDALALLHRAPVPAAEGSLTSALLERLG
jgi:diguanylate cyclase (GGDEF)-like protein